MGAATRSGTLGSGNSGWGEEGVLAQDRQVGGRRAPEPTGEVADADLEQAAGGLTGGARNNTLGYRLGVTINWGDGTPVEN